MSLRFINSIAILDSVTVATSAGDNHDLPFASSNLQISTTNNNDAITGLMPTVGAEDGAQCWLTNASATNSLVLKNNNSGSTAGFRFILPLGDLTLGPGASQHFGLNPSVGWVPISGAQWNLAKTVTPAGTTGAQTINKQAGSVNFAAGAATLVVTNSLCTTSSLVIPVVNTSDADMTSVVAVPANGSFTLIAKPSPPAAETRVSFLLL